MNSKATRARQKRRALSRGVTLTEVMIVVVILGLIAAGVGAAVLPKMTEAQIKTTRTNATAIHQAAEEWRGVNGGDQCPTVESLVKDKSISSASKTTDAWNNPYKIFCEDDETVVLSFGKDKKEGTQDDIRVPEIKVQQN